MSPATFRVHSLKGLPYYTRVRIWETRKEMLAASHAEGSVMGNFKAAHCGWEYEGKKPAPHLGDVFLFLNRELRSDAVHELTHAALWFVRQRTRKPELNRQEINGEATPSEETLCTVMENQLREFERKLLRLFPAS